MYFISPCGPLKSRRDLYVQLSLGDRQEDVHEFFLKLLEHFDEELTKIAEVFNLPDVSNIFIRSRTTWQLCFRTNEETEYLWVLTL